MPDIEKFIKGLECCLHWPMQCEKCPYTSEVGETVSNCVKTMRTDAISLLKDQEPRVMKLEEVKASIGEPIYFESHGTYMGKTGFWILPALFTESELMRYVYPQSSHYSELGLRAYGKTWRCWTSRPTDEQREAIPWND